jgi:transcriptional regulator with XRE-family HTH domain
MTLAEFVDMKMKERGLSRLELQRRSEKMITDSHIATVLSGKALNPSLRILLGLAKGLDVHPIEVFKAAAGVEDPVEIWTPDSLARAIQKMLKLKPNKVKALKKLLEE